MRRVVCFGSVLVREEVLSGADFVSSQHPPLRIGCETGVLPPPPQPPAPGTSCYSRLVSSPPFGPSVYYHPGLFRAILRCLVVLERSRTTAPTMCRARGPATRLICTLLAGEDGEREKERGVLLWGERRALYY